jgi:hypothetical protein
MIGLVEAAKRMARLDADDVFVFVFSRNEVLTFVEQLNKAQLRSGFDSEGTSLKSISDYSPTYRALKTRRGVSKDVVDLNFTGKFYDTIQAKYESGNLIIQGDTIKDGQDLQNRWGNKLIGISAENVETLREYIIRFVVPQFFNRYLS